MKKAFSQYFLIIVICIVITNLINFSTGCSKKEPSRETEIKLNVGIVTWPGFGPLLVAMQKDYFKQNGLEINLSIIEDEAARRSAFISGQLDIAANTVDALASGAPRGVNGMIFLKTDESFGADGIVARKTISSIEKLKGKSIAYPKGLPSHYFLYKVLKDYNLSLKDIKSVYMEASDAGAAFAAGKVDAAVTWEPWLSQSASKGNILATTKQKPGLIVDVLMVSPKSLQEKPEAIKNFLKGWFKGLEYQVNNPDESIKIISEKLKLSVDDTKALMSLVKFASPDENKRFFGIDGGKNVCGESFLAASDLWLKEKIIDKKAEPIKHCDGKPILTLQ